MKVGRFCTRSPPHPAFPMLLAKLRLFNGLQTSESDGSRTLSHSLSVSVTKNFSKFGTPRVTDVTCIRSLPCWQENTLTLPLFANLLLYDFLFAAQPKLVLPFHHFGMCGEHLKEKRGTPENSMCMNCLKLDVPSESAKFFSKLTNTVVRIAACYCLNDPGIESRWGRNFPHPFGPALGPTQPPTQWIPGNSRR